MALFSFSNFLVVDDHELIFRGLKELLLKVNSQYNIKFANSADAAHRILSQGFCIDVIFIDINLSQTTGQKFKNGKDLAIWAKLKRPTVKIIIITSHTEFFLIYDLIKSAHLNGVIIKSDASEKAIVDALCQVSNEMPYLSPTAEKAIEMIRQSEIFFDNYNRQIVTLLSQGILTKNIKDHLPLSQSSIDKRKALIKDYFNIANGSDEDIIACARTIGLIL